MPATYVPISSTTLTTAAANVTISNIPQTYTDLLIRVTARSDSVGGFAYTGSLYFNGSSGVSSYTYLQAVGTVSGARANNQNIPYWVAGPSATANNFSSSEIYVTNYTSTTNHKQVSIHGAVPRQNASVSGEEAMIAGLWQSTAAITSITLDVSGNFEAGSQFHVYGINKE